MPELMLAQLQVSVPPTVPAAMGAQLPPPLTLTMSMDAALDGRVSTICTVCAVEGPVLPIVATKVMGAPAATVVGVAVLAAVTSTMAVTWLVTLPLLLAWLGSPTSVERTVAVLVRGPVTAMLGRTTTVTVACAPEFSVPRLQLRFCEVPLVTALGVQPVPCEATADWNPPVFTTLMTYVRFWPATTGSGVAVLDTTRRSASVAVEVTPTPTQLFAPLLSTRTPAPSATQALLVAVPVPVNTADTVTTGALVLAFRPVEREQVQLPGPVNGKASQVQPVALTRLSSLTPAGTWSVMVMVWPLGTASGPVLRAVSV